MHVNITNKARRCHLPRGQRRSSAAAHLLRLWVKIPPGAWTFVCCECCVLSGRGLCDELISRPEESYRLLCVIVCDLETSSTRRPWPAGACRTKNKPRMPKYKNVHFHIQSTKSVICFDLLQTILREVSLIKHICKTLID
jgi:hypothetical protein